MVLAVRVDILDIHAVIDQCWQCADQVFASPEHVQHRIAAVIKRQPPMHLLLARYPLVVAPGPEHALALHHVCNGFAPAPVPDGRVSNPDDGSPAAELFLVDPGDLLCLPHRVPLGTLVWHTVGPVQLPDDIQPPVIVHRIPHHAERLGIAEVIRPEDPPGVMNLERLDHMRPLPGLIGARLVRPLRERLPRERVPAAFQ